VRKHFRRFMPDVKAMRAHPLVVRFDRWLHHPALWHFNRRSVPGAVAIGLFAGLVPGPLQMLSALLLAVPLRKNVPVALVVTFYTNPLTILPLYVLAFEYGNVLLGRAHGFSALEPFAMDWSDLTGSLVGMAHWCLALGKPLGVGLVALALTLAGVGYAATRLGWRIYLTFAWRARQTRRAGSRS
jgi:uncharacterized protein (DUF2062 family)